MMNNDLAVKLIKEYEGCVSDRTNWDSYWRNIAQYVIPFKDDVYQVNQEGQRKGHDIYDGTAILANETLASALHSMLTNPSIPWFGLSTGTPIIDNRDDVRKFLQESARIMHNIFNDSNFQTEIHEVYLDLGSFGTGLMLIEEDDDDIIRFRSSPVYTSHIKENAKGVVDTVYRKYQLTVQQIFDMYGKEAFPSNMNIDSLMKDSGRKMDIIHAVFPRKDRQYGVITPTNMPYGSVHILKEYKSILKESGYTSFPYVTPRWTKLSNELYGRSPAMKALPDIQMLNKMMKVTIRGAEKMVDPPLMIPDDGMSLPVKVSPSGVNYYRAGTPDRIEQMDIKSRPDVGLDMIEAVRASVRSFFFIDQLQLSEGPQMTATEVMQRTEEKLRLLAPILGRQHNELLKPLVERVFDIIGRKNLLPTAPEILRDRNIKVQYSSMIARSQKTSEVENLNRFFAVAAPIVQVDQTVIDNFDSDEAFRYAASMYNLPQELLRDNAEVDTLREERAAQAQAAQQQLQEQHTADVIQKTGAGNVQ